MQPILRFFCVALALGSAFAFGQNSLTDQVISSSIQQRADLKNVRVDQKPGAQLPLSATFTDDSGKTVTLGSMLQNRPLVLLPIFFRCKGVCEVELQGILNALIKDKDLIPGKNLDVAVLSINPTEKWDLGKDKKEASLSEYGNPQTAAGWHFLTGDMANIRAVTDAMGFSFTYDAQKNVVNHPSCIAVVTPQGRVSTYMLTGMYKPSALDRDVLLASRAGIAPKSEEIFFGCVHVDPITGKRSLVIQSVMRLMALGTVAALLIGIISMARGRKSSAGA